MLPDSNIGMAGYKGMAGSAILCKGRAKGCVHLVFRMRKMSGTGDCASGEANFSLSDGIISGCNDVKDKL